MSGRKQLVALSVSKRESIRFYALYKLIYYLHSWLLISPVGLIPIPILVMRECGAYYSISQGNSLYASPFFNVIPPHLLQLFLQRTNELINALFFILSRKTIYKPGNRQNGLVI